MVNCPVCRAKNVFGPASKIVINLLEDIDVVCKGPMGDGNCTIEG